MTHRLTPLCIVIHALFLPAVASADPITFRFAGTVVEIPPSAQIPGVGFVAVADPLVGTLTFDGNSPGSEEAPETHFFSIAPGQLQVVFPMGTFQADDSSWSLTALTSDTGGREGGADSVNFVVLNDFVQVLFSLSFFSLSDVGSLGDRLPLDPAVYARFADRHLVILNGSDGSRLVAELVSFELAPGPNPDPIPEPATLLLLTTGVVAFARMKRSKPSPRFHG